MTTKEFIQLETRLLPELPGFAIRGKLMFVSPAKRLLRGISFEGSSFDKTSFYVMTFIMPLFVPTDHLYGNFGRRVRLKNGADRWSLETPNIVKELSTAIRVQALPFLLPVESVLDFVELASSFSENPHTLRAIAFALAGSGQISKAVDVIDKLLNQIDPAVAWQVEIADQARALKDKLVTRPSEAQEQLETWEAETRLKLGLFEPNAS